MGNFFSSPPSGGEEVPLQFVKELLLLYSLLVKKKLVKKLGEEVLDYL
jgi:hypothetical protein